MTDLKIPNPDPPPDMFDGPRPSPFLSPADAALSTLVSLPSASLPTAASPPDVPPRGAPNASAPSHSGSPVMTDTTPSLSSVVYGVFDGSRAAPAPLAPADAAASGHLAWSVPDGSTAGHPLPTHTPSPLPLAASPPGNGNPKKKKGVVLLNADVLRELRESRMLSQQEMVNLFDLRNIRISIATIKRAETWHDVRYRIAHEFARFFGVPVESLLKH